MKQYIFLALIVICSMSLKAQETGHPTILSLAVNYTEDPAGDAVADSVKKVRLNVHITLKDEAPVSKIHLKIKSNTGDSVLYEVVYTVSVTTLVNDAGITLFKKEENGMIHISSPFLVPLTAYRYEISTEDSNVVESDIYSSIQ